MSGTMASKICPVCKTFTSSSNTTLNAHIDQCLSGESRMKRTANPKVSKNRIEPKKTRSIVEIYATARYCTLEELDRMNGTNWASSWILPAEGIKICDEVRKQKAPVNLVNAENEDSVYADANGTNTQTLSKSIDSSSHVKIGKHSGSGKPNKGDQGNKFLSTKKKKKKGNKQHNLQKCAPDSNKFCAPRPHHEFEIIGGQEQNIASEEICKKEASTQHQKTNDPFKFNDSGTILRWVCSKRTVLKKKVNFKHYLCSNEKKSQGENNESSMENPYVKSGSFLTSPKSSGTPCSSLHTNISVSSELDDEDKEELYLRKRARFSLLDSQACNDQNRSLRQSEGNVKHFRDFKDHLNNKENPISSLSSQRVEMKKALTRNADINSKLFSSRHLFSSKTKRFSSLEKDLVSVSKASVAKSKVSSKRKYVALKKPDEEAIVWQTAAIESNGSVLDNLSKVKAGCEETSDNVSVERAMVSKIRRDRGKIKISRKEKVMILAGSKSAAVYHEHDDDDKFGSLPGNNLAGAVNGKESAIEEVKFCGKDNISGPAFDMVDAEASMGKSTDFRFHDVAGCSDAQSDSRQFVEVNDGPFHGIEDSRCPVQPILHGGQEVFCMDRGEMNMGQNVNMRTELNSDDGPGNYCIEVDPIVIPGPPGSFLPSPGHMASEEIEGKSSLTSQIQSSKDYFEFADQDSSSSPSPTSTISNSNMEKFDSRFSEKLPLEPHCVQDEFGSRIYGPTADALARNSTRDPNAAYGETERLNSDEPTVNIMFRERRPSRFKNYQPCCCSGKEPTILDSAALNCGDLPVLPQQTLSLIPPTLTDKQMNGDANRKVVNCYLMSEVLSGGDRTGGTDNDATYLLGHIPHKISAKSEVKFLLNSKGETASPSKSNSVLRLMGKDLMVANTEDNMFPQLRPSRLPTMKSNSGGYFGNVQNKEPLSSCPSEGPIFEMRGNTVTQDVDVPLSNSDSNAYYGAPGGPTHASSLVHSGRSFPASSCASERLECEPSDMNKLGSRSSGGNVVSVTSCFNPMHVNPIHGFRPRTSLYGGLPLVQSEKLQATPFLGVSSFAAKCNCVPKGSNLLQKISFASSSSPTYI